MVHKICYECLHIFFDFLLKVFSQPVGLYSTLILIIETELITIKTVPLVGQQQSQLTALVKDASRAGPVLIAHESVYLLLSIKSGYLYNRAQTLKSLYRTPNLLYCKRYVCCKHFN